MKRFAITLLMSGILATLPAYAVQDPGMLGEGLRISIDVPNGAVSPGQGAKIAQNQTIYFNFFGLDTSAAGGKLVQLKFDVVGEPSGSTQHGALNFNWGVDPSNGNYQSSWNYQTQELVNSTKSFTFPQNSLPRMKALGTGLGQGDNEFKFKKIWVTIDGKTHEFNYE
jgi:hypothetical protein